MFGSEKIVQASKDGRFVVVFTTHLIDGGVTPIHRSAMRTNLEAVMEQFEDGQDENDLLSCTSTPDRGRFVAVSTSVLMARKYEWFEGILAQFEKQQQTDKPEDRITHPGFLKIAKDMWAHKTQLAKMEAEVTEESRKSKILCQGDLACDLDP